MIDNLKQVMEQNGISALFINDIHNVRYISGYKSDDAFLLITQKNQYFITDPRYTEEAEECCKGFIIANWRKYENLGDAIAEILQKDRINRLHFEGNNIGFNLFSQIQRASSADLIPVDGMIENLRSIKTQVEIEYTRRACDIGDRAFSLLLNDIKPGVTEREISAKLAYYLRSEGSDARCYENIVLSGARTSLIHGISSAKVIEQGDLILMDFGAGYQGYLSDMSRTIVVGKASDQQREIYQIIKKAEENMMSAVRSGSWARDTYFAAMKAIDGTEYNEYHYPGVGHGVGLAVHERPFIGPKSTVKFEVNNVITLEPGIYIPKWGGIRIEDQVLVTENGCEVLTKSRRELIELS